MTKNYKIVCIDKTDQVAKIIRAVFNSVPYEMKQIKYTSEILSELSDFQFNLLVINKSVCDCDIDDIKKIQISFPDPSIIIIDKELQNIDTWTDLDSIKFLAVTDIESKLPMFLGDFYSKDQNKFESSFTFFEILKNSLYHIKSSIFISDVYSNIIFMSKEAEKMLQIQDRELNELQLIDYMVDGAKVWNYITNHTSEGQESNHKYNVTFADSLGNEYEKVIIVHKLLANKSYVMIESLDSNGIGLKRFKGNETVILNKFADSIANELMNPINNISGRIQLLQSDPDLDDKYKNNLNTLENQVNRINETMSKLLTFARLKQDTIPQKIDLNDLIHKTLMDPSMVRLKEQSEIKLDFNLNETIPNLSGLVSHFNVLLKILFDICFDCLGKKGLILVETKQLNNYLNNNWILVSFSLDFTESLVYKKGCLQEYFKHSNFEANNISVESTIIDHIVQHYHGLTQVDAANQNKEIVMVLFPLPKAQNNSEDK
ncbi:MAG: histidine kinase dimerization/phospho-acceptor domain-containing protein [Calditrichaceae bacterium]